MYKVIKLNLNERFGLEGEDGAEPYFVKIIPIAFLPNAAQKLFAEQYPGGTAPDGAGELSLILDLLPLIVVDWNITDNYEKPFPKPREVSVPNDDGIPVLNADTKKLYGQIPLAILLYIFQMANEDTGDIPLVSENPSPQQPVAHSAVDHTQRVSPAVLAALPTPAENHLTVVVPDLEPATIDAVMTGVADSLIGDALTGLDGSTATPMTTPSPVG